MWYYAKPILNTFYYRPTNFGVLTFISSITDDNTVFAFSLMLIFHTLQFLTFNWIKISFWKLIANHAQTFVCSYHRIFTTDCTFYGLSDTWSNAISYHKCKHFKIKIFFQNEVYHATTAPCDGFVLLSIGQWIDVSEQFLMHNQSISIRSLTLLNGIRKLVFRSIPKEPTIFYNGNYDLFQRLQL